MPPARDPMLQPRVDPPRRMEPMEVRRRWPNAVEKLDTEAAGRLTVGSEGTLWFEADSAGSDGGTYVWHSDRGWITQAEHRPDRCSCNRSLKERGRCSGCGSWPSKCFCPHALA